eukprot:9488866-Pyramimonas_sp.AAC.1
METTYVLLSSVNVPPARSGMSQSSQLSCCYCCCNQVCSFVKKRVSRIPGVPGVFWGFPREFWGVSCQSSGRCACLKRPPEPS